MEAIILSRSTICDCCSRYSATMRWRCSGIDVNGAAMEIFKWEWWCNVWWLLCFRYGVSNCHLFSWVVVGYRLRCSENCWYGLLLLHVCSLVHSQSIQWSVPCSLLYYFLRNATVIHLGRTSSSKAVIGFVAIDTSRLTHSTQLVLESISANRLCCVPRFGGISANGRR